MIFYFTGTGNSLAAASRLGDALGERLEDIGKAAKNARFDFELQDGERLGFVFPTYAWNTPKIVDDFLPQVILRNAQGAFVKPDYSYLVVTCGGFVGNTARSFEAELKEKLDIDLDASFSVKTVGNCVYLYAPAEGERRDALLAEADRQTDRIAAQVAQGVRGHFETRNPLGVVGSRFLKERSRKISTKEFFAEETCTHCGFCVEICPTNSISIVGNKPHWERRGCTQCLACIHRCPAHAIQYGHGTKTRGRYANPVLLTR